MVGWKGKELERDIMESWTSMDKGGRMYLVRGKGQNVDDRLEYTKGLGKEMNIVVRTGGMIRT